MKTTKNTPTPPANNGIILDTDNYFMFDMQRNTITNERTLKNSDRVRIFHKGDSTIIYNFEVTGGRIALPKNGTIDSFPHTYKLHPDPTMFIFNTERLILERVQKNKIKFSYQRTWSGTIYKFYGVIFQL